MERFKVFGNVPEKEKKEIKKHCYDLLMHQNENLPDELKEALKLLEYPKTEKELKIIDLANKETNELLKEAGEKPLEIPPENFHFIPRMLFERITGIRSRSAAAITHQEFQSMFFNLPKKHDNTLRFLADSLHELLHLKSYQSWEIEENDDEKFIRSLRLGTSIRSPIKTVQAGRSHEHFNGLNEAIVETQLKKSFEKLIQSPIFEEENKIMESKYSMDRKLKLVEKEDLLADEIFWVNPKKDELLAFYYFPARKTLNYVLEEIQKEFPDKYISKDNVFKEFLRAHFQGELLGIAHLVDDTFGEGSFRILGDMETDDKSAIECLKILKSNRQKILK